MRNIFNEDRKIKKRYLKLNIYYKSLRLNKNIINK